MKLLTIANTKQKWLEMSFSSAGFFAFFLFVVCFKVLCANHDNEILANGF